MDKTAPTVSVIIPCRNEASEIEACLRSVLRQQVEIARLEVIVADGMSDDGTVQILRQLAMEDPRLKVIVNSGRIVSSGLNAAIAAASGHIIMRMDAHTEYAPDYIRQCLLVLLETGADNVGGPWVARGDGYISRAIAAAFQSPFAVGGARSHSINYEGEVDTVYLGCWRRELFARIGTFDEELVRNQDDELNLRLLRSGGRIWQSPKIRSWYRPRSSLRDLCRQYQQYGYWKVRVIQKHRLPASIRHVVPAGFVGTLVVLALATPFGAFPAYSLAALVGAYSLGVITASIVTAAQHSPTLLPILPLVFVCYHFSYAVGFLRGIWDFLFVGRVSATAKVLTRSTRRNAPK